MFKELFRDREKEIEKVEELIQDFEVSNEDLALKKKTLIQEKQNLTKIIETEKGKLNSLKLCFDQLKSEESQYKDEVFTLENQVKILEQDIFHHEEKIKSLRQNINQFCSDKPEVERGLREGLKKQDFLKNKISELEEIEFSKKKELEDFYSELVLIEEQNEVLEIKLQGRELDLDKSEGQMKILKDKMTKKEEQVKELVSTIKASEEKREKQKKTLFTLHKEIENQVSRIEEFEAELRLAESFIENNENEILECKSEAKRVRSKAAQTRDFLKEQTLKKEKIEQKLQNAQLSLETEKSHLKEIEEKKYDLFKTIESTKEDLQGRDLDILTLKRKIGHEEISLRKLEQEDIVQKKIIHSRKEAIEGYYRELDLIAEKMAQALETKENERKNLENLTAQKLTLEEEVSQCSIELKETKDLLSVQRQSLKIMSSKKADNEKILKDMISQKTQLQISKDELEENVKQVSLELESTCSEREIKSKKIEELKKEGHQLQTQFEELSHQVNKNEKELLELNEELNQQQRIAERLVGEVNRLEKRKSRLNSEIKAYKTKNESINRVISEQEHFIEGLGREIHALSEEVNNKKEKNQLLDSLNEENKVHISTLQADIEELRNQREKYSVVTSELTTTLYNLGIEVSDVVEESWEVRKQTEHLKKLTSNQIESLKENYPLVINELRGDYQNISNQLELIKKEHDSLKDQVRELEKVRIEKEKVEKELSSEERQYEKLKNESIGTQLLISSKVKELKAQKGEVKELKAIKNELIQQEERVLKELHEMEDQVSMIESDKESLQNDNNQMKKNIATIQKKLTILNGTIENLEADTLKEQKNYSLLKEAEKQLQERLKEKLKEKDRVEKYHKSEVRKNKQNDLFKICPPLHMAPVFHELFSDSDEVLQVMIKKVEKEFLKATFRLCGLDSQFLMKRKKDKKGLYSMLKITMNRPVLAKDILVPLKKLNRTLSEMILKNQGKVSLFATPSERAGQIASLRIVIQVNEGSRNKASKKPANLSL